MKKSLLMLFTLIWLMLASACGGSQSVTVTEEPSPTPAPTPVPTPMVMDVCLGTEGYSLDPLYVNNTVTASYVSHLFEGLTKYVVGENPQDDIVADSQLTLGMAQDYSVSEDGLSYTFHIRDDAYWSDGQPVRAQDFVYSWRRLIAPAQKGEMPHATSARPLYDVLKNARAVSQGEVSPEELGIVAESDKVLRIDLEKPCPYFLKLCASACLVPLRQDVIENNGGDWTNERNIVVNGAYTITHWVHDDYMTLEQNPKYYDRENLGPDTIVWHFSDSSSAALSAFQSGDYDFITTIPASEQQALTDAGVCHSVSRAGTYYLYVNANAIGDWRVRAAMMLAIDRDAIAAAIGDGTSPAVGLVPHGIATTDGSGYVPAQDATQQPMYAWLQSQYPEEDMNTYEGRCAVAKKLFNQALNAKSWYRSYQVYYRFNESTVNRIVADTCAANWMDVLGLKANFVRFDAEAYAQSLKGETFGVGYLQWMPDYNDPQSFLEIMRRGGEYNYSGWGDVRYDELLDEIGMTYTAEERDALQLQADSMLFTEGGFSICPIYYLGESYCAAPGLKNIGHSASEYYSFHYVEKTAEEPVVQASEPPMPQE